MSVKGHAHIASDGVAAAGRSLAVAVVAAVVALASAALADAAAPPVLATKVIAPSLVEQALTDSTNDVGQHRTRRWLRDKMVDQEDLARYGLVMDEAWQEADGAAPVVVLVHGYNSCPDKNRALLESIRAAGFPCGAFAYPNDQPIRPSAQLLYQQMRSFAVLHPKRRVALVCHSMGGMVARACVEDPLYDPGNIDRLIMIAPPSHGTLVANFAVGTDLWEHWLARKRGGPWTRFHDSVVDGLGEAADDLRPGSEFLAELNGRLRHPDVDYSILLGTGAALSESQLDWMRQSICQKLAKVPGIEGRFEKLDSLLEDLDELVDGKGDGVVAVKRGRLEGVGDTIVLPFGHLSVTGEAQADVVRDVQQAVIERLN